MAMPTCPECGGALTIDPQAQRDTAIVPPPLVDWLGLVPGSWELATVAVASCAGCEWIVELNAKA